MSDSAANPISTTPVKPKCQHEYVVVGDWQADDGEKAPLEACRLCAEFAPPPWQCKATSRQICLEV
ncbi:MAG: hypothetical protein UY96_C0010G0033 [Parcubacteria group bacterium GW2011_GWB1_56_8]|nr:MAG: hypothetical protein UY96_C0010G0033 [Parcubacteria group bacterium GW2011_GWB1_56_8]